MNCASCGAALIGNNKFCGRCGAKVNMNSYASPSRKCSQCGNEIRPDMKFCVSCGRVNAVLQSLQHTPAQPARQAAYNSEESAQFLPQQPQAPHSFGSVPGTSRAAHPDVAGAANQTARQMAENSSSGQRISLSAAAVGVICFFLPWIEVSCMGIRKTASGLQLASDANMPEIWLFVIAMLAAVGIGLLKIMSKLQSNSLEKLFSLGTISAGILPLAILLFEWLRFSNEISNIKGSDSYGFGRLMGSAIENTVSYQFGGILGALCSLAVTIGGLLHLRDSRGQRGSP